MSEYEETVQLAHRILDRPYADPDDDLAMLSRQFLRLIEVIDSKHTCNDDMEKAMLAAEARAEKLEAALREVLAGIEQNKATGNRHPFWTAVMAARAALANEPQENPS